MTETVQMPHKHVRSIGRHRQQETAVQRRMGWYYYRGWMNFGWAARIVTERRQAAAATATATRQAGCGHLYQVIHVW
uniref:Uncharacterized protein n=1 Tax=Plectus sambesii TaxID=2011161 RepID=A0A914UZL6_9BILA